MNSNVTVLYVDDEPINLELFEINYEFKYNVITAESGEVALVKLRENKDVAVVVTDLKMPGMDGLSFVKLAKQEFNNIPFIILTGFDISKELIEALNSGLIVKYLYKPFNVDEMGKIIDELAVKPA
ncbi:MAG TPA: response regulator [Tenuifilaceae bacterium]|nr:response regulator [Tenuifilaceae bacterium]HPE19334.1 response regulator [Tenuifilaceae bacterium]HPQ35339.1 response regulator [Tenuifilaceae bacterium]HRX69131.1 response regulator [Tenuifilaceae bacterium]